MVWQQVIEITENEEKATVKNRAGKTYQVFIYEDANIEEAKDALNNKDQVWGEVNFHVMRPYEQREVTEIEKFKIGGW